MKNPHRISSRWTLERIQGLFARVRNKQLQFALAGDVRNSERYALRARRIRAAGCPGC